jgi:eukaryotic-like serine/threonine-protein kinase
MANASHWDRVAELFDDAESIPPAERETFLRQRTTDPGVIREVLSLLSIATPASDLFEKPVMEWYQPTSFLGETSSTLPRLLTGELLAGRFRICGYLGRGGMAEVYAAHDNELSEVVALKLLHPDLAAQPAFLERFRREIRLTRRISHPNVSRVFDLMQDPAHPLGASFFFIMELLDGETLASCLNRRGALPPADALPIARQLAAGLQAAHLAGVIHRDFKPANIILSGPRAVITDFGLAATVQPGTGEAALKTTSMLLGTPGYVSPEQWAGKAASTATDIYAFGVVLHEMVTGRHPSSSECGPPPEDWARAIQKCLETDPRNRWKTPLAVVSAIEPSRLSRRNILVAAGVTGVVSLAGLESRLLVRGRKPARGSKLLMAGIQNITGDARFDGIGAALQVQLDQSTYFNMVDGTALSRTLGQMLVSTGTNPSAEQYREAAWRMNAGTVVFGTVAHVGALPNLTVEVEWRGSGPQTPSHRDTRSFPAHSASDLISTAREAANWIRDSAGDTSQREAQYDRLPEDVTTGSWEALSYYARAEQFAAVQRRDEALLQLDSALKLDPHFTLAMTRRADILNSAGREFEAMTTWVDVLGKLGNRRITRREELRALGMSAFDCGDYAEADKRFAQWASEYPSDARGYAYRATPLLMFGRPGDARKALNTSISLDPDFLTAHLHQSLCAVFVGDRALLDRHASEIRRLSMSGFAVLMETLFCFAEGDFERALAGARQLRAADTVRFQYEAFSREAMIFGECGNMSRALAVLREGLKLPTEIASARQRVTALISLAYCMLAEGQDHPDEILGEAIELRPGPTALAHAAIIASRARRFADASRYLSRLRDLPRVPKCLFGEALAEAEYLDATGQKEAASHTRAEAASYTAPYHAAPQAVTDRDARAQPGWFSKLASAAAFQWSDPFVPELGAWGRTVRETESPVADTRPEARKLRVFKTAMRTFPSNPTAV